MGKKKHRRGNKAKDSDGNKKVNKRTIRKNIRKQKRIQTTLNKKKLELLLNYPEFQGGFLKFVIENKIPNEEKKENEIKEGEKNEKKEEETNEEKNEKKKEETNEKEEKNEEKVEKKEEEKKEKEESESDSGYDSELDSISESEKNKNNDKNDKNNENNDKNNENNDKNNNDNNNKNNNKNNKKNNENQKQILNDPLTLEELDERFRKWSPSDFFQYIEKQNFPEEFVIPLIEKLLLVRTQYVSPQFYLMHKILLAKLGVLMDLGKKQNPRQANIPQIWKLVISLSDVPDNGFVLTEKQKKKSLSFI